MDTQNTLKAKHQDQETLIDLRALWLPIWQRRLVVLAVFAAVFGFGLLYLAQAPRIFKASTTLLIERKPPQVLSETREVYDLGTQGYWGAQEYYETQYNIIRSRPVAEMALNSLNLNTSVLFPTVQSELRPLLPAVMARDHLSPSTISRLGIIGIHRFGTVKELLARLEKSDPIAYLQEKIIVDPIQDSRLVRISVEDRVPETAALFANAITDTYIKHNQLHRSSLTRSAVEWLGKHKRELRTRLDESELLLHAFKSDNKMVSTSLEDRQSVVIQTLLQLNEKLSEVAANRFMVEGRQRELAKTQKGGIADGSNELLNNSLVQELKQSRAKLSREESELAVRYTAEHPKLAAIRNKIILIDTEINVEINKVAGSLSSRGAALRDVELQLQREITKITSKALSVNKQEITFNRLKRERDNNLALYSMLLKREKEAELAGMLHANNVSKLEAALTPKVPIRPKKLVIVAVTFLLSMLAGLIAAYVADFLDNRIKSQSQLESVLPLPFLGHIPSIPEESEGLPDNDRDLYITLHPRSVVAECCRSVRTNLIFMSPDSPAKTLLVTSSEPREGKSTTAIHLALTMANSGARTVLVDTDMRRPRLHHTFGVENNVGISSVIIGEANLDQATVNTSIDDLDILCCGPIPPNPAELMHAKNFKNIVIQLKERYDRVIFDSPPIQPVTDALVLASVVDGTILVVRANKTPIPSATNAHRRLNDVGAKIFGVVLNNVKLSRRQYNKTDYQYSYYGTGHEPTLEK